MSLYEGSSYSLGGRKKGRKWKLSFLALFVPTFSLLATFHGTKLKIGKENPGETNKAAWDTGQLIAASTFLKGEKHPGFLKGQASLAAEPLPHHSSRSEWPAWGQGGQADAGQSQCNPLNRDTTQLKNGQTHNQSEPLQSNPGICTKLNWICRKWN